MSAPSPTLWDPYSSTEHPDPCIRLQPFAKDRTHPASRHCHVPAGFLRRRDRPAAPALLCRSAAHDTDDAKENAAVLPVPHLGSVSAASAAPACCGDPVDRSPFFHPAEPYQTPVRIAFRSTARMRTGTIKCAPFPSPGRQKTGASRKGDAPVLRKGAAYTAAMDHKGIRFCFPSGTRPAPARPAVRGSAGPSSRQRSAGKRWAARLPGGRC